jgi:hypothetical protein
MNPSSHYLSVCTDTWMQCLKLQETISAKKLGFSSRTTQVLDECASICLGTMEAVKGGWEEVSQIALLCVGLCEECAEVCERYGDAQFQLCAAFCKQCSVVLTPLAAEAA